jgi:hypothetical protein
LNYVRLIIPSYAFALRFSNKLNSMYIFDTTLFLSAWVSLLELTEAGGEVLRSKLHTLINSVWNKEELPDQWQKCIILPVHKKGKRTDCSNYRGISLLSASYKNFIQYFSLKIKSIHVL